MIWHLKEIIYAIKGKMLTGGLNNVFKYIVIDSRRVVPKCIFISITGLNHKGIYFLDEIISKGASMIIINSSDVETLSLKKFKNNNITCIAVKDTIYALGELALYHRSKHINTKTKVVAITGSVGKTTTRGIASNILIQKYCIKSTMGNMNNHIGLPLTLLEAEKHHEIIILELGMSAIGEIKRLSQICRPDVAIIINVAETHLATLENIYNIAKAKSEIIEYVKPKGTIILNDDDYLVKRMSKITSKNKILFGTSKTSNILGKNIKITSKGTNFIIVTPEGNINIFVPIPSMAFITDILAASAIASYLGCSNNEIKTGIDSFRSIPGRMNIIDTKNKNLKIIDDTYNSSPLSLKRALETVNAIKNNYKTILAVIGDMSELGDKSEAMHIEAGKLIANSGINRFYAIGNFADNLVEGAQLSKMPINKIHILKRHDIVDHIKYNIEGKTLILIKGSRNMRMEKILIQIMETFKIYL